MRDPLRRPRSTVGLTDAPEPPGLRVVEELGPVMAERPTQLFGSLAKVVSEVEEELCHKAEAMGATHAVMVRVEVKSTLLSVGATARGLAVKAEV